MRKTTRDWLLERESGASQRLDSIRETVLAPSNPTLFETLIEIFRPNLPTWTALALTWLMLAAVHFAYMPAKRHPHGEPAIQPDAANLNLTHDETFPGLDPHS